MKIKIYILIIAQFFLISACNSQKKLSPEQQEIIDKAKSNFVFVKGGTFVMGKEPITKSMPVHEVTLDPYSISKYETSFKEFDLYYEIMDQEIVVPQWRDQDDMGPNFGALHMDWQGAKDYCLWLGKQLGLPIDLPTEAQWEYAARSRGMNVDHATNSGIIEGGNRDNYGDGEVDAYPPNPLGLYLMSGGREEWIIDWYAGYPKEPVKNPVQDTIKFSKKKVTRGVHSLYSSVYIRALRDPKLSGGGIGFRCVCNQKTQVN